MTIFSQYVSIDIRNHVGDPIYARVGDDNSRSIVITPIAGYDTEGEPVKVLMPAGARVLFRVLKPDQTFVMVSTTATAEGNYQAILPPEASQVAGTGYYDIRIQPDPDEEEYLYSAQGPFVIDDNMITDHMLESVAAVNGLIFPDDFLTTESGAAQIDDSVTTSTKTWSSRKIQDQIDASQESEIDDAIISPINTWSSSKISGELSLLPEIDDDTESTESTWSSSKIADEIAENSGAVQYSTTPKVIGKWIDGIKDVYEVTILSTASSGSIVYYFSDTPTEIISLTGVFRFTDGMGYTDLPIGSNFSYVNTTYVAGAFYGGYGANMWIRIIGAISGQSPQNMLSQKIVVRYIK